LPKPQREEAFRRYWSGIFNQISSPAQLEKSQKKGDSQNTKLHSCRRQFGVPGTERSSVSVRGFPPVSIENHFLILKMIPRAHTWYPAIAAGLFSNEKTSVPLIRRSAREGVKVEIPIVINFHAECE